MSDVAAKAGVSQPTVSHVLNDKRDGIYISEETRARVKQIALEMGYQRNVSAAATRTGRFGSIALLLSTHACRSMLSPYLLAGLNDALATDDLHLTLATLPDAQLSDEGVVPKLLREWLCDGLLIDYTHAAPESMNDLIRSHRLPAVWINSKQDANCVYPDDFEAGRRATEYLMELGHQRVAYFDATHLLEEQSEHYSAHDRRRGYLNAIQQAGFTETLIIEPAYVPRMQVATRIHALLRSSSVPSAFVCYGQLEAEIIIMTAIELGMKIPKDLSVVVFGPPNGQCAIWPLTTLIVPEYQMGRRSVEMLCRKISTQENFPPIALPFEFETGGTTAPPSK